MKPSNSPKLTSESRLSTGRERAILAASITLFLFSLLLFLLVSERAIAALWQWYKFYGYETPGVITMSRSTGLIYSLACSASFILSVLCNRVSVTSKTLRSARVSMISLVISGFSLAVYALLATSSLNVWRP
jgi:hypothetical protein